MPKGKRVNVETIIRTLRDIEIYHAQGHTIAESCRQYGITEQTSPASFHRESHHPDSNLKIGDKKDDLCTAPQLPDRTGQTTVERATS